MTVSQPELAEQTVPAADRPCWRELVQIALEGLPSPEFRLEEMMDRIESERPS